MGHLCGTRQAARKMALSISKTMREKLIAQLKKEDAPLSLILGKYLKLKFSKISKNINFLFWYPYKSLTSIKATQMLLIRASLWLSR